MRARWIAGAVRRGCRSSRNDTLAETNFFPVGSRSSLSYAVEIRRRGFKIAVSDADNSASV